MRQLRVLGLLAGLVSVSPSLAAEGTLNVTQGTGTAIAATAADGASNISVIQTLCGGASAVMGTACTNQAIFDTQGLHAYVANVNDNGQATMANSSPVVLPSDQFGTAAVANYGTAPTGTVIGVNAFVTNPVGLTWPGSATVTSYGTAPTGTVPGANVNCTNCISPTIPPPPPNDVAAGPQNFTGAATLAVNSQGSGSVGLIVSGTYTGAAWTLQASVDGTNYVTIPFWDNTAGGTIYTAQPSATSGGTYVAFAAGYRSVRINVTAVSTGTLVASLNSSAGSAQHPISTQGVNANINGIAGTAPVSAGTAGILGVGPAANGASLAPAGQTGTSSITVLSASGSGSQHEYMTGLQIGRSDAGTTAITAAVTDGTLTLTYVVPNSGGGGGNNITFSKPFQWALNHAVTCTASSGVTTFYCYAQGFNAP